MFSTFNKTMITTRSFPQHGEHCDWSRICAWLVLRRGCSWWWRPWWWYWWCSSWSKWWCRWSLCSWWWRRPASQANMGTRRVLGVKVNFVPPYHQSTNGAIERQHRTIKESIKASLVELGDVHKSNWMSQFSNLDNLYSKCDYQW